MEKASPFYLRRVEGGVELVQVHDPGAVRQGRVQHPTPRRRRLPGPVRQHVVDHLTRMLVGLRRRVPQARAELVLAELVLLLASVDVVVRVPHVAFTPGQ